MRLRIIALASIFSVFGSLVWAQQYTQQTTSVTSATVPVNVMATGAKKAWCIRPREGAANPVLCFAYNGAIPTGVPSPAAIQEVSKGSPLCDNLLPVGDSGINEPWACVLETGVTAVTVDATWR
jgi:hypothetical protein